MVQSIYNEPKPASTTSWKLALTHWFSLSGATNQEIALIKETYQKGTINPDSPDFDRQAVLDWEYTHTAGNHSGFFEHVALKAVRGLINEEVLKAKAREQAAIQAARDLEREHQRSIQLPEHAGCGIVWVHINQIRDTLNSRMGEVSRFFVPCNRCGKNFAVIGQLQVAEIETQVKDAGPIKPITSNQGPQEVVVGHAGGKVSKLKLGRKYKIELN